MKLSDFTPIETSRGNFAEVTVSTGILWWKKDTRRKICEMSFGPSWYFVDNGEPTPGYQAENLYRAWRAQRALSNG